MGRINKLECELMEGVKI